MSSASLGKNTRLTLHPPLPSDWILSTEIVISLSHQGAGEAIMWDFWNEVLVGSSGFLPCPPPPGTWGMWFSVCESAFGQSGSLCWRLHLAWSPFSFLKKSMAVVLAVGTGKRSCEWSQSSGKCRLQRFQLGVLGDRANDIMFDLGAYCHVPDSNILSCDRKGY